MITRDILKQIVMMKYLTDEMIDKLIPITEILQYDENEYLFYQGDEAGRFYFVLEGKVLLEQRISDGLTVNLSSAKPGYSVGWSAMLDGEDEFYTTDALCVEPTQLISYRAERLKALFEQDYQLGYIISHRLLHVVKRRYDKRTEQFIKAIENHPEIGALI